MMSNFAIIRQEKVKSEEQFNAQISHNTREFYSSNIDKKRSHKNITLTPFGYHNFKDFIASKRKLILGGNKNKKKKSRMLRKIKGEYQSASQELIFSHSPEAMSEAKSIEFLKLANTFLREWFKELEVLSSVIHLDETTPHLHFNVTYFDEEQAKFVQSDLQKQGKTDINNIRNAWNEYLEGTEFEHLLMQDGSVIAEREHKRTLNATVKDLEDEIKELVETNDRLVEDNIVASATSGQNGDKEALAMAKLIIDEKDAQIGDLEGTFSELAEKIETLAARLEKLVSDTVPKESEVIDIREAIKETKKKVAERTKKGQVLKRKK